jgi:hypothetical protein
VKRFKSHHWFGYFFDKSRVLFDNRIDLETKQMAERASAVLGCSSLTEYITRLIRDNSPNIIQHILLLNR